MIRIHDDPDPQHCRISYVRGVQYSVGLVPVPVLVGEVPVQNVCGCEEGDGDGRRHLREVSLHLTPQPPAVPVTPLGSQHLITHVLSSCDPYVNMRRLE